MIFALTVMGLAKPIGSNNFDAKLNFGLLVSSFVILLDSRNCLSSVSSTMLGLELQVSPRIFVIGAACVLSFCAWRLRVAEVEVHLREFISASCR